MLPKSMLSSRFIHVWRANVVTAYKCDCFLWLMINKWFDFEDSLIMVGWFAGLWVWKQSCKACRARIWKTGSYTSSSIIQWQWGTSSWVSFWVMKRTFHISKKGLIYFSWFSFFSNFISNCKKQVIDLIWWIDDIYSLNCSYCKEFFYLIDG